MTDEAAARNLRGGRHRSGSTDWVQDAVFYGIDIARFFDGNNDGFGDMPGLIEKLDYLRDLGVSCLWLLPFYPSDRQDNGYDVTNYVGVDPRFGQLDDFRTLAEQAHERGIRIMADLVVHHTSSKHPWFAAAESDPDSRYGQYYVWSGQKPDDSESKSVFPEEEDGIWEYSERAGAYYRHRFYSFEPDLQLGNDEVWDDVKRIIDFWVAVGVDGFRVDAATLMFADPDDGGSASEGHRPDGDRPSFAERFDDLRDYLNERAPHVALLGEADVRSDGIGRYFENGRFDLLYSFLGNNAIYLSLVRESSAALAGTLTGLRDVVLNGHMVNFMRNLDELDLEQLSGDERAEVLDALAPDENMRIYGRGIRRGWAPMMRSDEQLRMTMSLIFALPGVPLLMYGQEIGMGDDLSRPGRDVVRLPMQWSDEAGGGFADPGDREGAGGGDIADLAKADAEFGYARVNVRSQWRQPDSLLTLTRDLIRLRARHAGIGKGGWDLVEAAPELLVLRYGNVVAVHNFSGRQQELPDAADGRVLLGADVSHGAIPAYGYAWVEITRPKEASG